MGGLSEVFRRTMTDAMVDVYFKAFSEYRLEAIEHVIFLSIKECTRFPKPKELLDILRREARAEELAKAKAKEADERPKTPGAQHFWLSLIRRVLNNDNDIDKPIKTGDEVMREIEAFRAETGARYPDPETFDIYVSGGCVDEVPF